MPLGFAVLSCGCRRDEIELLAVAATE